MKTIVYYHGDADGECSAVAYKKYSGNEVQTLEAISYGYDSTKMRDAMHEYDRVVFVDFTPTLEDIEYAHGMDNCKVEIYDHHWSAFTKFADKFITDDLSGFLEGLDKETEYYSFITLPNITYIAAAKDSGLAGCGLVWTHFNGEGDMPTGLKYVNDYDVWNHSNPDVVSFHTAMAIIITDPTTEEGLDFWNELLDLEEEQGEEVMPGLSRGMIPQLVNTGDLILKYKYAVDERRIKHAAQVIDWDGDKGYLVNCEFEDSYSFRDTYEEDDEIKFFIWYNKRKDGRWKYSFRVAPEHEGSYDVAEIARAFGGNGHPGAAGCLVEDIIDFEIISI